MERIEIIDAVGREYHTSNIENGEFSYPKAFKEKGLDFDPIKKKGGKGSWQFLDIRFVMNGVSLLIETKNDADKWPTVEDIKLSPVDFLYELINPDNINYPLIEKLLDEKKISPTNCRRIEYSCSEVKERLPRLGIWTQLKSNE